MGQDMFPNIVNVERTQVFLRALQVSNRHDWSELKRSIYISMITHIAGMGYEDSYRLFPKTFHPFSTFMTRFFNHFSLEASNFIHGGMDYIQAHNLIINYPEFQAI
jgi:hypothetical protein